MYPHSANTAKRLHCPATPLPATSTPRCSGATKSAALLKSARPTTHSIPINYGPASFKSCYRQCSGGHLSTTTLHSLAGALPINPKDFTSTKPGQCAIVMIGSQNMAERVLPKPDAFATCPHEGRILEYYAGTFEAVFVQLHPFIDATRVGTDQFESLTYPGRQFIRANCRAVPWAEVTKRTGLPSLTAIDIGLADSLAVDLGDGIHRIFRKIADPTKRGD